MKKIIVFLTSVIVLLAILFMWGNQPAPHNTVQETNEITTEPTNQEAPEEIIEIPKEPVTESKLGESSPKESTPETTENLTCTLSIKCDTILNNLDKLDESKKQIIPENGVIYSSENIVFYEGESVFNVLSRELKQNKIHFDFSFTPIYETAYIKGIANIYEFDCGELSGWIYKVNGQTLNVGVSSCMVKNGDKIELLYTCALGKDL